MKRLLAIVLGLVFLVPAAFAEAQEYTTAYVLDYDREAMPGWNAREHLEAPGTVITLYCDSAGADVLVSLIPREDAANANDYLFTRTMSNADIIISQETIGPATWAAPWGEVGAAMERTYVYAYGDYISNIYREKAYAAVYNEAFYLVIVITLNKADSNEAIAAFETAFFTSELAIRPIQYTRKVYGYLHEAQTKDGALALSFDTFIVEGGDETNDIVIYNNDPSLVPFTVDPMANLWTISSTRLFVWERMLHDASKISSHISDFVLSSGGFPPFLFCVDGDKIVWMEQQANY